MNNSIIQSLLKISIFIMALLPFFFLNQTIIPASKTLHSLKKSLETLGDLDTSYYFVGSSRVITSVNIDLLKTLWEENQIHNLGIGGAGFLENCLIVDYLVKTKGFKKIYVELSLLHLDMSAKFLIFCDALNIKPISTARNVLDLSSRESNLIRLNNLNNKIYSTISLKSFVKRVTGYKQSIPIRDWLGYSPRDGSNLVLEPLFLTIEDLKKTEEIPIVDLSNYWQAIDYLIKQGKENKAEIVFFLPMNYKKHTEKNIVIPLFNSLNEKNKLEFTEDFVIQMSDPELLYNTNHYDKEGGKKYTELLVSLLTKYNKQ